jgi:hypothetical protein
MTLLTHGQPTFSLRRPNDPRRCLRIHETHIDPLQPFETRRAFEGSLSNSLPKFITAVHAELTADSDRCSETWKRSICPIRREYIRVCHARLLNRQHMHVHRNTSVGLRLPGAGLQVPRTMESAASEPSHESRMKRLELRNSDISGAARCSYLRLDGLAAPVMAAKRQHTTDSSTDAFKSFL